MLVGPVIFGVGYLGLLALQAFRHFLSGWCDTRYFLTQSPKMVPA
jgi:hypothetical protein